MSRVALLSDEPIFAAGFATAIGSAANFQLVAVCDDQDEFTRAVTRYEPDLLVIDRSEAITVEWLARLRRHSTHSRIVLWVYDIAPEIAYQTIRAGVRGILRKTVAPQAMLQALASVAAGECWFEEDLTASFVNSTTVTLSARETDLVSLVSQGLRNKEIAHRLGLTDATVKVYLARLFRKLGFTDRVELALFGIKNLITNVSTGGGGLQQNERASTVLVLNKPANQAAPTAHPPAAALLGSDRASDRAPVGARPRRSREPQAVASARALKGIRPIGACAMAR